MDRTEFFASHNLFTTGIWMGLLTAVNMATVFPSIELQVSGSKSHFLLPIPREAYSIISEGIIFLFATASRPALG